MDDRDRAFFSLRIGRAGKRRALCSTAEGAGLPLTKEVRIVPSTGDNQEKRRDPKTGRFVKGNRSGGRPQLPEELKMAFRAAAPEALDVLLKILRDEEAKHGDRIRCAEIILDRGYGKPVQAVDLETTTSDVGVVLIPARTDG
jgi:hypothetical protein